nr:quinone oxidoreductase-like protein 2 isoform X2 [Odocoileus virginianus texanus]
MNFVSKDVCCSALLLCFLCRSELMFISVGLILLIFWPVMVSIRKGINSPSHLGDRVIGLPGFNGMAEECIIDHKNLWQIPEKVSLREAAALPVSYGTAIFALEHRACTQPGETVLVTAAAGATGLAVIDVATNILQAKVIAAAGSDEKCQLAMQRGAQSSVNYSRGSLKEAVGKLVGSGGVNVVIDMVGGDVFLEALRSLAYEGRIVVVGFAGGTIASIPANLLLLKSATAMGLYWGRYRHQNFPIFSRTLSSALQYCQEGRIQPHIGEVFKLEEVNDAFLHVTQRKSTGKCDHVLYCPDLDTVESERLLLVITPGEQVSQDV